MLEGRKDVVAVPNAALRRDAEGSYVLVPDEAGSKRRNVRAGFRGTDYTELLSGAKPGEHVLVGTTQPRQTTESGKKGV